MSSVSPQVNHDLQDPPLTAAASFSNYTETMKSKEFSSAKVFNVERIIRPDDRPRKKRCTNKTYSSTTNSEGMWSEETAPAPLTRVLSTRRHCSQSHSIHSSCLQSESVYRPSLDNPATVLQAAEGDAVIASLQRIQSRSSSQKIDYPPGAPFWAFVSAAFFNELVSIPVDSETVFRNGGLKTLWEKTERREDESSFSLGDTETRWKEELSLCTARVQELLRELKETGETAAGLEESEELSAIKKTNNTPKSPHPDDQWTALLRSRRLRPLLTQLLSHSTQSNSPLPLEGDYDIFCDVCADGDYTDDNLIAICSGCEVAVHMKCYGIEQLPDDDWFCEECKAVEKPTLLKCSICQRDGGVMKRGETEAVGKTGWAHVFCVDSLPGAKYRRPESKEGVDLSEVDPRRCLLACQLCKEKEGACLQCTFKSCMSAFHPGCWKATFVQPNLPIESVFMCSKHRSSTLFQTLERREKNCVREIQWLYKELIASDLPHTSPVKHKPGISKFDKKALLKVASRSLNRHNFHKRRLGFNLIIDKSLGTVIVDVPIHWNLLSPEVFRSEHLFIPGKTEEESAQLYQSSYSKLFKRTKRRREEFTLTEAVSLKKQMDKETQRRKTIRKLKAEKTTTVRIPLHLILDLVPQT